MLGENLAENGSARIAEGYVGVLRREPDAHAGDAGFTGTDSE